MCLMCFFKFKFNNDKCFNVRWYFRFKIENVDYRKVCVFIFVIRLGEFYKLGKCLYISENRYI